MKPLEIVFLLLAAAFFFAASEPSQLFAEGDKGGSRYCDKTGKKCHHVNGAGCGQGGSGLASSCSMERDERACFDCDRREGLLCGDQDSTCGDLVNAACAGGVVPPWGEVGANGSPWFKPVDQDGNTIRCEKLKDCVDGSASKRQC